MAGDGPGDNDGHRRSIAVHEKPEHNQHKRRDQHRLTAQSLDGMQGVTDVGDHALERHEPCDAGGCAKVDAVPRVFREGSATLRCAMVAIWDCALGRTGTRATPWNKAVPNR
jgi:hypothetical protein